ncbi:MAG: V-type ATP synthase subunit D [Deltaproteobacteria bacterium]
MSRLSLPATKGNLIRVKDEQLLATEAVTFLEEKRDLLLGELLRLQGQAAKFRRQVDRALKKAYGQLEKSLLSMGREAVARAALGVKGEDRVRLKDRGFLGMPMPVVELQPGEPRPHIGFGGTVSALDECQLAIREALAPLAELAEVEAILWRLADELQRTVRRTNALNYMFIPTYEETIHYLEGSLEEREREGLFHLKRAKARKQ